MSDRPTGKGVREIEVTREELSVGDWVRLKCANGDEHGFKLMSKSNGDLQSAYNTFFSRADDKVYRIEPKPPKLPKTPGSVIRVTTKNATFTAVRLADGWTRADNSVQARSGWETRIANAYARDGQWRIEVLYNAGGAA